MISTPFSQELSEQIFNDTVGGLGDCPSPFWGAPRAPQGKRRQCQVDPEPLEALKYIFG